jgi:peptidoglycan/LPS O-acetylase OafA/YrhL
MKLDLTRKTGAGGETRLGYLEGLRGIAATIVALGHLAAMPAPDQAVWKISDATGHQLIRWPTFFGAEMVWLFIMISGFSLYWSESHRRISGAKPTRIKDFVAKRAWRILPTYFAAIALGFLTIAVMPFLIQPAASMNTSAPLSWGGVISHFFLVQNLRPAWGAQINPPLLTIAIEVHLYLLFPLLLAKFWRGSPYLPAIAIVISAQAIQALTGLPVFSLAPWFFGGVVVAHLAQTRNVNRLLLGLLAMAGLLVGLSRETGQLSSPLYQLPWLIGFSCLLLFLFRQPENLLNVATWTPTKWLGKISYSLYAVHFPIGLVVWGILGHFALPRSLQVITCVVLGFGAALGLSILFYKWIERPSLARVRMVGTRNLGEVTPDTLNTSR